MHRCGLPWQPCRDVGSLSVFLAALLGGSVGLPRLLPAQQAVAAPVPPPVPVPAPVPAPAALVFRGATVIDVTDGRRLPDQTVVIVGNRIQAVGPAKTVAAPTGARVVDARGKYLLPGFWDMHVHAEGFSQGHQQLYPLFVANGITGIREMAQRWGELQASRDSFRAWQREILAGTLIGPRGVGPSKDIVARLVSAGEARLTIDLLKAAGDAFVKSHGQLRERDVFFALLRQSRQVGLPVVGHVPETVTAIEAADSGMRSIEHDGTQQPCWRAWDEPLPDSSAALDSVCGSVAQAYIRNGTWLTPTMSVSWLNGDQRAEDWPSALRFWRMMHRLGVRNFLAGTDWMAQIAQKSGGLFVPGLSAREELVLLADAGLTPLEALQAGTLNPAIFLEATDSLGTVAAGKLADLVLLDGDPLADITNVLKLWSVVANGRYFDHDTLVQMHAEAFKPDVGFVAADRRLQAASGSGARGRPSP